MDSESGKQLYKFDRSMMERLVVNGFPMSQLNVQRRMRPLIADFPRYVASSPHDKLLMNMHISLMLYPSLKDHPIVRNYPAVQGMQKDVFFLTHTNPEGGEADSVSKFNSYEVLSTPTVSTRF